MNSTSFDNEVDASSGSVLPHTGSADVPMSDVAIQFPEIGDGGSETRLLRDYEAIRREEYGLMTELVDLLPRIDGVRTEASRELRDAMFHADSPFLLVFAGPFSSGKSTIINALLGEKLLDVGPVPTTDRITIVRWGDAPQRMSTGNDVETVFYPV